MALAGDLRERPITARSNAMEQRIIDLPGHFRVAVNAISPVQQKSGGHEAGESQLHYPKRTRQSYDRDCINCQKQPTP